MIENSLYALLDYFQPNCTIKILKHKIISTHAVNNVIEEYDFNIYIQPK